MQTPTLHWETLPLATRLGVNAIASGVLEYFLPSIPFSLILFFGYVPFFWEILLSASNNLTRFPGAIAFVPDSLPCPLPPITLARS